MPKKSVTRERQPQHWAKPSKKKLTKDNMKTLAECELIADWTFWAIKELHGEKEARRIFATHGSGPAKRELKLQEDASLLLAYLRLFLDVDGEPSIRRFVRNKAKEANDKDVAPLERKFWRILNDEKVWEHLYDEGYLCCPWPMPKEQLAKIKSGRLPNSFLRLFGLIGPR
jgi:hypothetical protein